MTDLFDILTPSHTSNLPAPANQARYQTQAKANHQALILPPISTAHLQPPRRSLIQWRILLTTRKGKLIWFECKRKSAPDVVALNQLAIDIDKVSFESDRAVDTALSQIAYTHDINFLRGNFLDHQQWPLEAWQRDELMHTHFTTTNIQQLTQQREAIHQRLNQTLSDGLQTFSQTLTL